MGRDMTDMLRDREQTQPDAHAPSGRKEITAERYLSTEILSQEWEHLWPRTWLYVGVASDVSEPGEFFVFNIGPESILVSHTDEGEIAAFYNACQHRGAQSGWTAPGWTGRVHTVECLVVLQTSLEGVVFGVVLL